MIDDEFGACAQTGLFLFCKYLRQHLHQKCLLAFKLFLFWYKFCAKGGKFITQYMKPTNLDMYFLNFNYFNVLNLRKKL